MAQILDHTCIRSSYSRLARKAESMKFKAEKVHFAERAPERSGLALKRAGWVCKGQIYLETCQNLNVREIWYKTSTFGGAHKVYIKK